MSFSWSTAQLGVLVPGDEPVSLRYGDTHPGRSDAEPYTTIIAFHGSGFNSIIWSPWLEHLPTNVRLIAVNRRGFLGSGPVHESQQLLPNNPEAFGRYVVDTLAFITFVVDVLKVPSRAHGTGEEGIVLLGWSKGCSFLTALLATLSTSAELPASFHVPWSITEPYLPLIRTHVKSAILFEPSGLMAGIPLRTPSRNGALPPAELGRVFVNGILQTIPAGNLALVEASVDDMMATGHDLRSWNGATPEECKEVATMAFEIVHPCIGVGVIYCTGTMFENCIAGSEWIINHCVGQVNTTSRIIPGGNHFVMVTDPELFNEAVISSIRKLQGVGGVLEQ